MGAIAFRPYPSIVTILPEKTPAARKLRVLHKIYRARIGFRHGPCGTIVENTARVVKGDSAAISGQSRLHELPFWRERSGPVGSVQKSTSERIGESYSEKKSRRSNEYVVNSLVGRRLEKRPFWRAPPFDREVLRTQVAPTSAPQSQRVCFRKRWVNSAFDSPERPGASFRENV